MSDPTQTAESAAPTLEVSAVADKPRFIWGVGRRKSSTARVRIAPGSGRVLVKRAGREERELNDYFPNERDRKAIFGPLEATQYGGKIDVFVTADGGGKPACAERGPDSDIERKRGIRRHGNRASKLPNRPQRSQGTHDYSYKDCKCWEASVG